MLWTDDRLRQVIARYTPVLHLHHEEQYMPCSVEWYMERSQLWLEEPVDNVGFIHMFAKELPPKHFSSVRASPCVTRLHASRVFTSRVS